MNDPLLMRGLKRVRDLRRDRQGVIKPDRATRDALRQVLALDEFHDQRTNTIGFFETVDRGDVRMVQRRERLRFAREPGEPVGIVRKRVRKDFECDIAIQLGVAGAVHPAHAPFADLYGDFVVAETSTGGESQIAVNYMG